MSAARLTIRANADLPSLYSDSRTHLPQGGNIQQPGDPSATRNVRLPRATQSGGIISKSEDGLRCVVGGREYLRIIRATSPDEVHPSSEHRWSLGPGGYRLDASRNMWDGSGLKVESTITDVAWCHGRAFSTASSSESYSHAEQVFNHKILTGAKSGELIMWDLTRSSKFERKAKDHVRSVHKLAVSPLAQHYCVTGSADGDLRAWDIRDMQRSIMRIRNASAIRAMAFSPNPSSALQVIAGFENGSLLRLDLRLGQRGTIDRLPVAHSSSVTSMDWCLRDGEMAADTSSGLGWLVTSGLDKTVKIWDLTKVALDPPASGDARGSRKPSYTLHPSFPVRRVLWRPGYVCEVAVISNSNAEFGSGNFSELAGSNSRGTYASVLSPQSERVNRASATADRHKSTAGIGDAVEIWDARRGWIAKWSIRGSAIDGGVTDIAFRDSHALWASHSSGMFSQLDLRESIRPIDAIPRSAVAWEASGSLAFAVGSRDQWEVPYDDLRPDYRAAMSDKRKNTLIKALGDPKYQPQHQTLANFSDLDSFTGIETITKFARAYTIEGFSRLALCEMNAQACTVFHASGQDSFRHRPLSISARLTDCHRRDHKQLRLPASLLVTRHQYVDIQEAHARFLRVVVSTAARGITAADEFAPAYGSSQVRRLEPIWRAATIALAKALHDEQFASVSDLA
ncbi:unnamed protein product [Mycena citricolor]|uniref:WD40 repeat-like protein n=1 Tax=Mycena citricolor TaxID=2018698 RepID=A0AAD2HK63_9AGAR|nr:unnamed protein product [Mycena citricolor]